MKLSIVRTIIKRIEPEATASTRHLDPGLVVVRGRYKSRQIEAAVLDEFPGMSLWYTDIEGTRWDPVFVLTFGPDEEDAP